MSTTRTDPVTNHKVTPEQLYGVYVNLDGAEEDTTIRPTCLSPQTIRRLKEGSGLYPELEEDQIDWDAH